jgi:8-hydroxy-5-deazaflavin:NADPH oxidoreductase
MNIGIVGAGYVVGTLAAHLTRLGHRVTIANSRGPNTLAEVAARTGATPGTVEQAAQGQELVIVTITQKAIPNLPKQLFAGLPAKAVVVDIGNYYPHRDGTISPDRSRSAGEPLGRATRR